MWEPGETVARSSDSHVSDVASDADTLCDLVRCAGKRRRHVMRACGFVPIELRFLSFDLYWREGVESTQPPCIAYNRSISPSNPNPVALTRMVDPPVPLPTQTASIILTIANCMRVAARAAPARISSAWLSSQSLSPRLATCAVSFTLASASYALSNSCSRSQPSLRRSFSSSAAAKPSTGSTSSVSARLRCATLLAYYYSSASAPPSSASAPPRRRTQTPSDGSKPTMSQRFTAASSVIELPPKAGQCSTTFSSHSEPEQPVLIGLLSLLAD
jgi:hypothetical protein